ncbi:VOC family protein [Actinoallomurus sp. CA-142502]|uniref:VOC family protein n=1 Tax=Actinoallomurus sp. CA-142502 TaxID=3239885 RepID=UPI003D8A7B63
MNAISELSYLGIVSPAYEEWIGYGTKVLGAEAAPAGPDGATRLRVDDMGYRIAVHPGEEDRLGYVGWGVTNERHLAEFVEHLRSHGVEVHHADEQTIAERQAADVYWFADPFGIRHELAWGRSSYPGTFTPGRRLEGKGFVTGDLGLGHVVLIVPDIEAANAFYADVLGFRLSDRIISDIFNLRFYHCNERHHSLAVAHIPGMVGINHLMLEVRDFDDLGHCIDLCGENDVDILLSLGRHTNDLMTSIYIATPSGMQVEYGYGGLRVDDLTWIARTNHHPSIWGHHRSERYMTAPPGIVHKFEGQATR